jgi:hypothetical protein
MSSPTEEEKALLAELYPLIQAELRRIGVSEADELWIHAGGAGAITKDRIDANLKALRALPTGMGVVGYCRHLGFDYHETKRALGIPD